MSSSKVKSSSSILNILIIAIGVIFLFRAVVYILTLTGVLPEMLAEWNDAVVGVAALGGEALVSLVLAFWCIVAGIAMFKEAEWAMGQALVVLSIMAATGVDPLIGLILDPTSFSWGDISGIINIVAFIVGVVGFIWLLITRRRYD